MTPELKPRSCSLPTGVVLVPTLLVLLALCFTALPGFAQTNIPAKPTGYVNDYANVLSPSARQQLEALCTEVDQKAMAQIAVVTVRSLEGRPIEDYAVDLFNKWGVGPKESARGVLILLAIDDRKTRIKSATGLEPILPDGKVGDFVPRGSPLSP